MRRIRFHIGTLVILILVLGVSFAALRESNDLWDSGLFTVTFGVFLISILLAVHRTGSNRRLVGIRPVRLGLPGGSPWSQQLNRG